ncbi:MAG: hypothetical protein AVDCRST_MAG83-3248 [uncultured Arthrobacter sp.]|uniref:Uncharacterized protein n=1 Tax=uncultured Arthrobacter sp. TaxID=114050 RepID=A0A6J4J9U0_9MICC|nr:MAG: hypothetical protein AVDCRST_MAG83-3248 [uncultured Arthrobacter sp.]
MGLAEGSKAFEDVAQSSTVRSLALIVSVI